MGICMVKKLSIKDVELEGKRALIRVDFNVPLDNNGAIFDDTKILASLQTIQYVLSSGGSCILMSHFGRPTQKSKEFSLAPCAERLSKLLHRKVTMAPDCIGTEVEKLTKNIQPGDVIMLENVRFYPAEEKPDLDPDFAKTLASYADIFINDAFGSAHRAHSSTATVAKYFPGNAVSGFLIEREMEFLGEALLKPKRPFFAIIGGVKVSTKLGILKSLLQKVDALFIGGAMAYTFLKALDKNVGNSIVEAAMIPKAKELIQFALEKNIPLYFPEDTVITNSLAADAVIEVVQVDIGIPESFQGVDIGPKTIETWTQKLKEAKTILWNGPVGIFENPKFSKGTFSLANTLSQLQGVVTIVGGGDSVAAIQQAGCSSKISHISTGGGASLEYIEKGTLPGIEALSNS